MDDFKLFLIQESLNNDLSNLDDYFNQLLDKYTSKFDDQEFWKEFLNKCRAFLKKIGFDNFHGCGRHRCAFSSKDRNFVVKIPNCYIGIMANYDEYNRRDNNRHANCRLLVLPKTGIAILLMEKLETNYRSKELPKWAGEYDCFQVGKNKKGEYKAYDYTFY